MEKCKLLVQVTTPSNLSSLNVYLIIPSLKVITEGYSENDNNYAFLDIDGSISLPVNSDAFIIAIAEQQGIFYYKQKRFTIKKEQLINMELAKATKENIYASFELLQFNKLNFTIEKAEVFENEFNDDTVEESTLRIPETKQDSLIAISNLCDCGSLTENRKAYK